MPSAFYRTTRSLNLDHFRFPLWGILCSGAFLCLWLAWAVLYKINLYETSQNARIEVFQSVFPIQASVAGRIVRSHVTLGQKVQQGDVLFELDYEPLNLRLAEEQTRLESLQRQLNALHHVTAAEKQSVERERTANQSALKEAQSRYREGEVTARLATTEAERIKKLFDQGLISQAAFEQASTKAEKQAASAQALLVKIERLKNEQSVKLSDREAHLEDLQRDAETITGDMDMSRKAIARLQQQVEYHIIRAPISGTVGELVELRPGSVVATSESLATIVPVGDFRIVAYIPNQSSVGRVVTGQTAEMRLNAFPWMQYGTIKAEVINVGSEPKNGAVRIECFIKQNQQTMLPMKHGLTGSLEIAVERLTPANLILRQVGEWLTPAQQSGRTIS